ncbi:hypothetical protein GT755_33920 [Herbidospora sp. NEAU-GS84]|uniref:WD40 repeat domain-containing protein n=1 Tax=Herbidospora solisilvae TaxID=2696284 RepID=A0A7C9K132_9ACTN|nr:hypothetical protein [Herbidospora solisilvae]NAS26659.1 hypothetical protein [Herbidospora solisilvae]
MNEDTMIKEALRDWAQEVRVPADLAERALRTRRRRRLGFAGSGAVLVAAAVTAVVTLLPGASPERTIVAERPTTAASPAPTTVHTDTENDPPVNLIAAGPWAVGSYYSTEWADTGRGTEALRYTWSVYDQGEGRYVRTPYQWVDVLPGMGLAAVLMGDLPSRGLGLVDLKTMMFTRWWDLEEAAGSVFWSPDGSKLVLTTYSGPPDEKKWLDAERTSAAGLPRSRTGFYVIDPNAGTRNWRPLPPDPDALNGRDDLRWDDDSTRLWAATRGGGRLLYDTEGTRLGFDEGHPRRMNEAGVSPNGRLRAGPAGLPTRVTDVETGEVVGRQQMLQLWAWVDDDHLIGLGCARDCDDEFDSALVMVSVDGKETTRLASYRDSRTSWRPVLVRR